MKAGFAAILILLGCAGDCIANRDSAWQRNYSVAHVSPYSLMNDAGWLKRRLVPIAAAFPTIEGSSAVSSHPARSNQIRAAMILWSGGAAGLIETITPAALGNRKTWRVTHYAHDPTESKTNDYDLYDLDRDTLAPIRSVRNTQDYQLELSFGSQDVMLRKTTIKNTTTEGIPLTTGVQPEGPGLDVFVGGLPLQSEYKLRYSIVDRWSGREASRVKTLTLSVLQKSTEDTSIGRREIYELLIRSEDNSFQIKEKVLAESPHYPVWVEYIRDGKTYPASEVISLVDLKLAKNRA